MIVPRTSRGPLASVAGASLAGAASAALLAAALVRPETILVFLVYLTALPLFIAGLGAGGIAVLIASLTGTAGLYLSGPSNYAFVYAFIFAIPAIVMTMLTLKFRLIADKPVKWYPEGELLTVLTVYPCLIFLCLAALATSVKGGLLAMTVDAFNLLGDKLASTMSPTDALTAHNILDRAAHVAPAIIGIAWIFVFLICMGGAQIILQKQQWNLRDRFGLKDLQVPGWLIYAVAATGLIGSFAPAPADYIGSNISFILGLPFFFVGLAVIHSWATTTKMPVLILAVIYIATGVVVWLAILIVLLGMIDQWADFRRRMSLPKIST